MSTMIGLLQILVISSLGLLGHRHDANAVPLQRTATPEGWVAIEEVGAGEVVWTYDVSQAQWQPGQVAKVFEHAYEGDMVRLQVANDRVVSTGNHPYWVVDGKSLSERGPPTDVPDYQRVFSDQGRWVEARDLQAGDLLRTRSGTAQIAKVETFTDTTRVYNLEVATHATYAVSPQALLVHNKSMRNTSLVDDVAQSASNNSVAFYNKTHKGALPKPRGKGPRGGRLQSHHGLQQEWAIQNLKQFKYDPKLAPTITIETGRGFPHSRITNLQNARRNARLAAGKGKWSSSLQDELGYIVEDFHAAGLGDDVIRNVLNQQYKMLDKLGVPYTRIPGF